MTTYTFRVSTLDDDKYKFSNLIIRTINQETQEFIAHYSPTDEWQIGDLEYEGIFNLTDTNGVKIGSNVEGKGSIIMCTFSIDRNPCYGESCPCTDGNGVGYTINIYCSSVPSGGGGSGGGNNPPYDGGGGGNGGPIPTDPMDWNGGSGGSGGSGGGGSNNGNSTSAFDLDFLGQLTTLQRNWIENPVNENTRELIEIYLNLYGQPDNQNGWYGSSEAVWFAIEWLNDLMNGNFEYQLNHLFINFQNDYRSKMSESELEIFDTLSPQSQYKYLKNAYFASERAKQWYPESLHNGKGDAFRHAYFNALNVISIGEAYAQLLSTAHEDITFNPQNVYQYKEKQMDLHNNQIGRNWGVHYLTFSNISIRDLIKNAIDNGELRYLKPLGFTTNGGVYQATWANFNSKLTRTNL